MGRSKAFSAAKVKVPLTKASAPGGISLTPREPWVQLKESQHSRYLFLVVELNLTWVLYKRSPSLHEPSPNNSMVARPPVNHSVFLFQIKLLPNETATRSIQEKSSISGLDI